MTTNNLLLLNQTEIGNKITVNGGKLNITANSINLTDYDASEIIDQKDEINSGFKNLLGLNDSQTFTTGSSRILSSNFGYYVYSGSSGMMRFFLQDISTGDILASIYVGINSTDNGWFTQPWSIPVLLKANTQYIILYQPNDAISTIKIGYDATGSYSGGNMGSNPSQDYMFRIYGVQIPSLDFINGAITGVSENPEFLGNLSATNAVNELALQNYVLNFYSQTRPFTGGNPQITTPSWYLGGYFSGSDFPTGVKIMSEVFLQNYSTLAISRIILKTSWMAGSTVNNSYLIEDGYISSLRPVARIYRNPTTNTLYIYYKIPSPSYADITNYLYNMHGISTVQGPSYIAYAGTGTNPSGVSGYTLLYDSSIDAAGLDAPKTVSFNGPFASSPQSSNIYFDVHSHTCNMTLSQLVATGNASVGLITAPAGTIPDRLSPYGYSASNMPNYPIFVNNNSTISIGRLAINTSLDGGFTIFATPNGGNFNPGGGGIGFYNITLPWNIRNT